MSGTARRRTIRVGAILIVVGIVVALTIGAFGPYGRTAARWLARGWPAFLILAGVVRLIGFAAERKPRSPVSGGLLIIAGALLLVFSLSSDQGLLQIYGRYWPVVFVVFAGIGLVRYYSHRASDGPKPRLFTPLRLMFAGVIVASGVLANHLSAADPSLGSRLELSRYFRGIRDSVAGRSFTFTEAAPAVVAGVPPGSRISVLNGRGSVRVIGGSKSLRAVLTKNVQAWDEQEARQIADKVHLVLDQGPQGYTVRTASDGDGTQGDIDTHIQLEAPADIVLQVKSNFGKIEASGIRGSFTAESAHGQVAARNIAGDVKLDAEQGVVEVSDVVGSLSITGANRIKAEHISGSVALGASNGTVSLSSIGGPVEIEAPYSNITLADLEQVARIKVDHGSVKVSRSADLEIEAAHSKISAEAVTGSAAFTSSHSRIRAEGLTGSLKVAGPFSAVSAKDIHGPVEIDTNHGEVSLEGFDGTVKIRTSHQDVKLALDSGPVGDIVVDNEQGGIRLRLPNASLFQLEATSPRGRIKVDGFEGLTSTVRDRFTQSFGTGGPRINLRTSRKTITVMGTRDGARPKGVQRTIEGRVGGIEEVGM